MDSPFDDLVSKRNSILSDFEKRIKNVYRKRIDELKASNTDPQLIIRSQGHCDKFLNAIKKREEVTKNNDAFNKAIQEYAQAIFDVTFIYEQNLIEADFPKKSNSILLEIFSDLYNLLNIFKNEENSVISFKDIMIPLNITEEKQLIDALGIELVECIYWRLGALAYMYASTLISKGRLAELDSTVLDNSIMYLENMIKARIRQTDATHVDSPQPLNINEEQIAAMVKLGVYSDTHLLALVYAGESAFMKCKYFKDKSNPEMKQKATSLLKSFVELVNKYLKVMGWSPDKANELLSELEHI